MIVAVFEVSTLMWMPSRLIAALREVDSLAVAGMFISCSASSTLRAVVQ
jgi:hypothetical protein